ncbi:SVEP1-like protein, partial [Mya arenaria]
CPISINGTDEHTKLLALNDETKRSYESNVTIQCKQGYRLKELKENENTSQSISCTDDGIWNGVFKGCERKVCPISINGTDEHTKLLALNDETKRSYESNVTIQCKQGYRLKELKENENTSQSISCTDDGIWNGVFKGCERKVCPISINGTDEHTKLLALNDETKRSYESNVTIQCKQGYRLKELKENENTSQSISCTDDGIWNGVFKGCERKGYRLKELKENENTSQSISCTDDGIWNGVFKGCERKVCPISINGTDEHTKLLALNDETKRSYESNVTIQCKQGYRLKELKENENTSQSISCTDDGIWNGVFKGCERKVCPISINGTDEHTKLLALNDETKRSYESNVTIQCKQGYRLKELKENENTSQSISCTDDGIWNGVFKGCERKGYRLKELKENENTSQSISCTDDGIWNGVFKGCERKVCPISINGTDEHTKLLALNDETKRSYESNVTIQCKQGYRLKELKENENTSQSISCTDDGIWNGVFKGCERKVCPISINGTDEHTKLLALNDETKRSYESNVTIQCKQGYRLKELKENENTSQSISCTDDGIWNGVFKGCERKVCPISINGTDEHTKLLALNDETKRSYESNVTIQCKQGYRLKELKENENTSQSISCTDDGIWNGVFKGCERKVCPISINGTDEHTKLLALNDETKRSYESNVTIQCKQGYRLKELKENENTSQSISCTDDGIWNGVFKGCERKVCPISINGTDEHTKLLALNDETKRSYES